MTSGKILVGTLYGRATEKYSVFPDEIGKMSFGEIKGHSGEIYSPHNHSRVFLKGGQVYGKYPYRRYSGMATVHFDD